MNTPQNIIHFSENALNQVKKLIAQEPEGTLLRLGYESGGCSGFQYIFKFVNQKEPADILESHGDFKVVIDSLQIEKLKGLQIDYEGGLKNRGFKYTNPNAQSSCGCGTSFN